MASPPRQLVLQNDPFDPIVWLGQSVDTSSICSSHPELSAGAFLTSLGCAIRKPSLKETHFNFDLKAKLGVSGPLMVDSGGFALLMAPATRWSVRDVARQIRKIDADIFVSLDYPPGITDARFERRKKIARSVKNFKILSDEFERKVIMPVVHGRTLSEIDYSINLIAKLGRDLSWIALGGIVPLLLKRNVRGDAAKIGAETFIARSLVMIREAFPEAKIHAFGAGGMRTFPAVCAFGADSADSIGWRSAAGFGSIFLPFKSQRIVTWNPKNGRPPRRTLDESDLEDLRNCRCPTCRSVSSISGRIKVLRRHFYNRSIHNAWVSNNQFRYWPRGRKALRAELAEGKIGREWSSVANNLG